MSWRKVPGVTDGTDKRKRIGRIGWMGGRNQVGEMERTDAMQLSGSDRTRCMEGDEVKGERGEVKGERDEFKR